MATNLNMPQMGYDMQEGTLVRWLKSVGDEVSLGEAVAEIETDKAVVEFESTAEGVLLELLVEEGTTVAVGESIATVGAEGEALAADGDAPEEPAGAEPAAEEPAESDEAEMPAAEEDESESAAIPLPASPSEVRASPVARKLAAERVASTLAPLRAPVLAVGYSGRTCFLPNPRQSLQKSRKKLQRRLLKLWKSHPCRMRRLQERGSKMWRSRRRWRTKNPLRRPLRP